MESLPLPSFPLAYKIIVFSSSAFIYEYFLFTYFDLIHTEILRLPQCDKVDGKFSESYRNKRLVGSVINTFNNIKLEGCTSKCLKHRMCMSVNFFNYRVESLQADGICELNSKRYDGSGKVTLKYQEKSTYIQTPMKQQNVSDFLFYGILILFESGEYSHLELVWCKF